MVNRGRSKGCNTCRQRRVRCDETKPTCRRCAALGRPCGGYLRKISPVKFKLIETSESYVSKRGEGRLIAMRPARSGRPVPALHIEEDHVALCFFISNFATIGRDSLSTRGFFEMIQPILSGQPPGSAISRAVGTLSTCMYTRYKAWPGAPNVGLKFGRAIQQLQAEIDDPTQSRSDTTLLATMVLQFYDNLSAVHRLRRVERTHHDGALALIRHRGKGFGYSPHGRWLLGHVLHTAVSSAIREKRSLTEEDLRWLDYDALPLGPSPALDLIGISIANLQHEFVKHKPEDREGLLLEADSINNDLIEWKASMPAYWRPHSLENIPESIIQIPTFDELCDVYPSVQIGSILNLWRSYRLIVMKISLVLHNAGLNTVTDTSHTVIHGTKEIQTNIRDAVDGICASIPFFLGNRRLPATMSDFTDPNLRCPSYHDIPPEHRPKTLRKTLLISKEEHIRHIVAQGMWQIMSPLSHIVSLCSEQHGHLVMGCLRDGQIEWLRRQLRRTGIIMRVDMGTSRGESSGVLAQGCRSVEYRLAEGMRDGLRMTSGS